MQSESNLCKLSSRCWSIPRDDEQILGHVERVVGLAVSCKGQGRSPFGGVHGVVWTQPEKLNLVSSSIANMLGRVFTAVCACLLPERTNGRVAQAGHGALDGEKISKSVLDMTNHSRCSMRPREGRCSRAGSSAGGCGLDRSFVPEECASPRFTPPVASPVCWSLDATLEVGSTRRRPLALPLPSQFTPSDDSSAAHVDVTRHTHYSHYSHTHTLTHSHNNHLHAGACCLQIRQAHTLHKHHLSLHLAPADFPLSIPNPHIPANQTAGPDTDTTDQIP